MLAREPMIGGGSGGREAGWWVGRSALSGLADASQGGSFAASFELPVETPRLLLGVQANPEMSVSASGAKSCASFMHSSTGAVRFRSYSSPRIRQPCAHAAAGARIVVQSSP